MACREGRGHGIAAEQLAQGPSLWVVVCANYYKKKKLWEGAPRRFHDGM